MLLSLLSKFEDFFDLLLLEVLIWHQYVHIIFESMDILIGTT